MTHKTHLLITLFVSINFVGAQQIMNNLKDTLGDKSYDYLSIAIDNNEPKSEKSRAYSQAWLKKAKSEKNYHQMAMAYKAIIHNSSKELRLQYADSMIAAAKQTNKLELIGAAYMTRGIIHYGCEEHMKSLDDYLIADKYISQTGDQYLIHKVKFGIADIKYYLGFYDEAIALFRECIDYFKEENDRAYLNSLHGLGLCYNQLGNYAWSTVINQTGIEEGRRLENLEMEAYFIHSEGINLCKQKKYKEAIQKLNVALPGIIKNKDFANEAAAYLYIGKSYWSLNQKEKAITYFKKVDSIFESDKYIRPDLREGFEKLIGYYKNVNDTKSQLYYIDQLLKVDKVLGQNYKYLLKKIVKEYDTKELLKSKQEIENAMTIRTIIGFSVILFLIYIIVHLIRKHCKNKRLFEEIMKRDTSKTSVQGNSNSQNLVLEVDETPKTIQSENNDRQNLQEISPDFEAGILKKLEKFEQTKKYLEKDMTLTKMALLLNTNNKYVTKIIAKHRGKGSIEYITDLKIDFIVEMLKTDSKFRNYTNKALADEAGFGSTQNFTKAFKERNGITPTYFVYKLKKSINSENKE